MELTQEELKRSLSYDPDSGRFLRVVTVTYNAKQGDVAGGINGRGYVMISVKGKRYLAHRLAFLYMTGSWPIGVDHINHKKDDNRWRNLREANQMLNCANGSVHRDSTSKHRGVSFQQRTGKWIAQIRRDGISKWLGYHDTELAAARAYEEANETHR